jgi:hypothetical protein
LVIPNATFYLYHGVTASGLSNVTIYLEGILRFERRNGKDQFDGKDEQASHSFSIRESSNVIITSSNMEHRGVIDGQGSQFWGEPMIGYLNPPAGTDGHRPQALLHLQNVVSVVVERIILRDSPLRAVSLAGASKALLQNVSIVNRRTAQDGHSVIDLSAVGTVGIDISEGSNNVRIRDTDVWTQDDCISLRSAGLPSAQEVSNVLIENVNASGMGLSLTAAASSVVNNVTIRDLYLHKPVRGFTAKFLPDDESQPSPVNTATTLTGAVVSNVRLQNVYMESPMEWSLWLGPAQTSSAANNRNSDYDPCDNQPCSLCWPAKSGSTCRAIANTTMVNVTLVNVTIRNPLMSPGVLLADSSRDAVMESIVMDHVRVVIESSSYSRSSNQSNSSAKNDHAAGAGHPIAPDLVETFPGLRQPLRDEYVPRSTGSDPSDSNQKGQSWGEDGGADASNDEALAVGSSSSHLYLAASIGVAVVCAIFVVASPLLGTFMVSAGSGSCDVTVTSSTTAASHPDGAQLSENEEHPAGVSPTNPLPSSSKQKRVRFASGDDVSSMLEGIDPQESASSPMTVPLLDEHRSEASRLSSTSIQNAGSMSQEARRVANNFRWTHGHWIFLLTILTAGGLAAWCWKYYKLHNRNGRDEVAEWEKTDRYYLCQGVTGIARGGTWPVPTCLNQHPSQWWVWLRHLHGAGLWITVGCTCAILLTVTVAIAWKFCKRRDRFRPLLDAREMDVPTSQ